MQFMVELEFEPARLVKANVHSLLNNINSRVDLIQSSPRIRRTRVNKLSLIAYNEP
jgi:hypothetical protein